MLLIVTWETQGVKESSPKFHIATIDDADDPA